MLAYEEVGPPLSLAPFVRCFWTLRGEGDPGRPDRILPDGSFEAIFHLGEPFSRSGEKQHAAILVGEIRRPTIVASSRRADVFGIRFRLGGLAALTGLHARELRDQIVDLRDLLTGSERIFDAADRLTAAVSFCEESRTRSRITASPQLRAAVSTLVRAHGAVRVRGLAGSVGTSERTLERLFDRHVGLGPKELARVIRFQAALRGIDGGYYDDSHRIHEFRELAGATPSVVLAERSEITDAFVGNLQDDAATAPLI